MGFSALANRRFSSSKRLLGEPGGFEGFFGVEEVLNRMILPFLNSITYAIGDSTSAPLSRATPPKLTDCENSLAKVTDLRDLDDLELRESLV